MQRGTWQAMLERWRAAGLLDEAAAERIRTWEVTHGVAGRHDRLAQLAFGLGGLLLAAGVLLFVAAHWDTLAPAWRFALLLLLVGVFHVAAVAVRERLPALATTLHAVGTAALGAGVFLAGQIFNLAEHWPGGLLLWSIGALAALHLLRDWPHVLWVAVLVPAWLVGEWIELDGSPVPALAGLFLLALVYLSARIPEHESTWRTALARLGGAAIIPVGAWLAFTVGSDYDWGRASETAVAAWVIAWVAGWGIALALPAALAWVLRGREAAWLLPAWAWVLALTLLASEGDGGLILYVLYALAAAGLVYLGVREQQRLTVNLGVLGFALTVLFFYFANLYDKLGRALGLIGIGVVLIGGGWLLERMRRQLVGRIGAVRG